MNNPMAAECEARLLKLQQYVPFLQRAKEFYISSPEDGKKITQLIAIISNAERCREQLRPETLERCENFCRMQYSKFGKEDEVRLRKGNNLHSSRENNRFNNPQQFRKGPDHDETPRSPSPEETERFSVNCVPKAIPNQRTDSDLRINPTLDRPESINRDSYRRASPVVEPRPSPSRPLRTEPIEIPTMPQIQTGSRVPGFSNQDQDYRPTYDQAIASGRHSLEERRVTYNNRGSPDAGMSFPKRESRFDRYVNDRSSISVGSVRPYEDSSLPNNKQTNMNVPWDPQHSRKTHSAEKDRSFQSRGPPNLLPHTSSNATRPGTFRWDTSNVQNPHFPSSSRIGQTNRTTHDRQRESIPGQHVSPHSFRTGESSNHRIDRQRPQPSRGGKNWSSSRDQSPSIPQQNVDRSQVKADRNYSQNDALSRQGLLRHPPTTSFPVPNTPTLTSRPQSRVPIHNSNSLPTQQQPPVDSSSSHGPSRREDPRLITRPKQSPVSSLSNSSIPLTSPLGSPIQTQQFPSTPTPVQLVTNPPQRSSSSSMPGSSRFPLDLQLNQLPENKITNNQPPKGQNNLKKCNTGDSDVRKESTKTQAATDNASEASTRNRDEFVSPLDSLYSGTSKSGQTGRGYGVQTYKIPKKKTVDYSKGGGKQVSPEADPSIVILPESSSVHEISEGTPGTTDTTGHQAITERKPREQLDLATDDTPIPLEILENFLKKNLPSEDAKMVLDRIKTKSSSENVAKDLTASHSMKQVEPPICNSNIRELNTAIPLASNDRNITPASSSGNSLLLLSEGDEKPVDEKTGNLRRDTTETANSSEMKDPVEVTGKKKGRPKNSVPLELARLKEDLTDFMKGGMELGSRRCRSKSSQPTLDGALEDGDKRSGNTSATAKRGRKRKADSDRVPEVSSFSPIPPSEEGNDNLDDTGSTYSSSLEISSVIESPNQLTNPVPNQRSSQCLSKKVGRGKKSVVDASINDPSPESKASKKRKKPLVPTHLSLRGRRSMYEDAEQENLADQYFQCQTCSYLGQKIVHHYVNEHHEFENPYISVPESSWEEIINSTSNPSLLTLNLDVLSDLSWIPTRSNYTSPVQCKLCAFHTSKRSELLEHVMIHALPTNYNCRCLLCGSTEKNFFNMLDHVASHTGEFRYKCNYCNFQVAHRSGIKHHMNSMHESQDGLFYNTKLFDEENVPQLCISGFVCKTCRYVQMYEEGMKRHEGFHPECEGRVKVNLISFVQDPTALAKEITETKESRKDCEFENFPDEKEKGVFLCPTLKLVTRKDDLDEDQMTVSLKLHSVSLIETLAEKLSNPESSEQVQNNKEHRPILSNSPDKESVIRVPSLMTLETSSPNDPEKLVVTEIVSNETEFGEKTINDPPRLLMETWKQNALLQTIISKLSDKLGGSQIEANTSTDVEDAEDIEDIVGEEESEESFDDSEIDSEGESVKDQNMDQTEVEQEVGVDINETAAVNSVHSSPASAGFLRIENVISLNDFDEDDSLDPVSSADIYSKVTVAKDEVTFPFITKHDRSKFAALLKDREIYQSMLDRERVRYLFKCMAYRCMFSSDSARDFKQHLLWHTKHFFAKNSNQSIRESRMVSEEAGGVCETITLPDFHFCSCCPFAACSSLELVEHIENIHGSSEFQCSACFFRSRRSKIVDLHIIIRHQGTAAFTLSCKFIASADPKLDVDQLGLSQLPKYRCCVEKCGFACILRNSFIKHLSTCHYGMRHFTCLLCKKDISCNNSDYTQYFLHMNTHDTGFFQCAFCLWGSDLSTDVLIHQCLYHPSMEGKVFTRSSQCSSSSTTLIKYWHPGLPHAYAPTHKIDFEQRFRELFEKVRVFDSLISPTEDIVNVFGTEKTETEAEYPISVPPNLGNERAITKAVALEENSVLPDIPKDSETEFHGFGEEEKAKAKEQTECIIIVSDVEDENSSSPIEPPAAIAIKTTVEPMEQESDENQEGLFGRKLYMCGNIGCDETAETAATFKEHLLVCDLARDSRLLTCRHCGKNIKQVSNLIEHLRSHGIKRFLCGLCNHRSNQAAQIRKHMKTVHRVNVCDEVPIGSGSETASSENLLHALYPREMIARLKLRMRGSPGKKSATKAFSCRDAQTIPMRAILPAKVKCAHCGYASIVRTNMVRHLSMHQCSEITNATSSEGEEIIPRLVIPDQDPVNPVPHLESPSQGMMFDKMANLAYSSHVKEKPASKERMSKMRNSSSIDDSVALEKALEPVFIPDHQRYVCGFNDCGHLTINETMLKYHVQALHKNAVFSCPHCNLLSEDEPMSMEAFRGHLKMHGPQLFKCGHCTYFHWHQQDIDYHLKVKHPNRQPWRILIRDPTDLEVKRLQNTNKNTEKSGSSWNCSLCKQVTYSVADMQAHVESNHGVKSQFKCALCPVRCNVRSEFDRHFAAKHPNQDVQVLTMFYEVENSEATNEIETTAFIPANFEPLWKKNDNRLRHIRGILLEEDEIRPSEQVGSSETKNMQEDPVFGRYGEPCALTGQYCCPKCNQYRVSYSRDLRIHLYKELDYKKFLCSICNEGSWSRALALTHVGKLHPNSGAYIREITSNRALEDWVGKVVKVQTDALKILKAVLPNANKAKKSVPSSSATSTPSSPAKSPLKSKKAVASVVSASPVSILPKPIVITVDLEPLPDISATPLNKNWNCLSCQFVGDSEKLLEEHVVAKHAHDNTKSGNKICLECGFRATPKQSLVNHQKKTKHTKTNEVTAIATDDGESEGSTTLTEVESTSQLQQLKKSRPKTPNPYRCKHCKFSAVNEHGINLHWQRIHSSSDLPLDFECDISPDVTAAKPESTKIYYKCQLCSVQPGLYEEMRLHSKTLHPNCPVKIFRITSKVKGNKQKDAGVSNSKDSGTPPVKITRVEKSAIPIKEAVAATSSSFAVKSQPPKLIPKMPSPSTSGSSQTVFVVAPPANQPAYACAWCNSKFQLESQVIRHHATHLSNIPLRYTCTTPTLKSAGNSPSTSSSTFKPELAVMEIRFGCPICTKYFISLIGAQQHVVEHKQVWKCGHCVMLFGTPTLALQHWKEVHPGLQGQLESIDSPSQIVDRLSKGITIHRVQLNMKSLLKDKSSLQSAELHASEVAGTVKEIKETPSIETPTPSQIPKNAAVARKSTSGNLFLKENMKQESVPSTDREGPPAVLEVTRIK